MSGNGFSRFFSRGFADADARLAAALAPRPYDGADRYLRASAAVRAFDRFTCTMRDWWRASQAGQAQAAVAEAWQREAWPQRYRTTGSILLTAAAVHAGLTLMQGPRPGWFWMLIPSVAAGFGLLLLVASRGSRSIP